MSFLLFTNWHLVKKTKMVTELTQKYVGRGLQFCSCEFIKEKGFKKPSYRSSFKKNKGKYAKKKVRNTLTIASSTKKKSNF